MSAAAVFLRNDRQNRAKILLYRGPEMGQQPTRLEVFSGWKEIANYLGKGVRTVQRYECELRLPIHRPAGKSSGSVIATKVELDAWIAASPVRDAFRLTKPALEFSSLREELKSNIEQLRQLRLECRGLRGELHRSVELLHQSIRGVLPQDFPSNGRVADGLIFDPKKKAN